MKKVGQIHVGGGGGGRVDEEVSMAVASTAFERGGGGEVQLRSVQRWLPSSKGDRRPCRGSCISEKKTFSLTLPKEAPAPEQKKIPPSLGNGSLPS